MSGLFEYWREGVLRLFQRLIDVGKNVVDMFESYGEANHAGSDAGVLKLLIRELAVG